MQFLIYNSIRRGHTFRSCTFSSTKKKREREREREREADRDRKIEKEGKKEGKMFGLKSKFNSLQTAAYVLYNIYNWFWSICSCFFTRLELEASGQRVRYIYIHK